RSIPTAHANPFISRGSENTIGLVIKGTCSGGIVSIVATAARATGISARKPAIGPATPISKTALLDGIGDVIFMKAPKVPAGPMRGGVGIKYGSVASTL